MKTRALLLLASISPFFSQAQILKDGCEFLDTIQGNVLVTFTADGLSSYTEKASALWYYGSKRIVFDESDLTPDSTLIEGAELFNYEGDPIGVVNAEIKVEQILEHTGFRMADYRTGIIHGYLSKFDTRTNSRPEDALEKLFNENQRVNGRELIPLLEELGFEEESVDGFNVYVLRNFDQNNPESVEFPFRVLLIMRGSSSIQCMVTTTERIETISERDYSLERGRHYTWFQVPNNRIKEQFTSIVYKYLPL